ncbi:Fc.00g054940.m01.CDS01 [Cosmosporella sp. VM-42]
MEASSQRAAPTFLSICPLCDKAYTREYSYNRHIKYCQRALPKRKGRPKSCTPCSKSKTKCSFTKPQCSRCETKGVDCVYDQSKTGIIAVQRIHEWRPETHDVINVNSQLGASTGQAINWTETWPPLDVSLGMDASVLDFDQGQLTPFETSIKLPDKWVTIASQSRVLLPAVDTGVWQPPLESSSPQSSYSSCEDIISLSRSTTTLIHLRHGNPASKYAASLISNILSAFPQMMLRRQTFPPFIHPYWYSSTLPEKLSVCMSIAQLFAARTPETRPFLWRVIETEEQRFRDEMMDMPAREIQPAVQSIMIYIIMAIVDQDADTPKRGERMIRTFIMLSLRFLELLPGEYFSNTEETCPSTTWEDWVFAESRRRVTCLCFILSRIVPFDHVVPCTNIDILDVLPLISSKTLWEARSQEEWETEKLFYDASCPMIKFGELVQARRNSADPRHAQKLENWEAGADKMAVLINIATAFV